MAFGSGKNFIFQLAFQLLERQKSINLAEFYRANRIRTRGEEMEGEREIKRKEEGKENKINIQVGEGDMEGGERR